MILRFLKAKNIFPLKDKLYMKFLIGFKKIEYNKLAGKKIYMPFYNKRSLLNPTGYLNLLYGPLNGALDDSKKFIASNSSKGISKIIPTLVNRWFTDDFVKKSPEIIQQRLQQVIDTDPNTFFNVFLCSFITDLKYNFIMF